MIIFVIVLVILIYQDKYTIATHHEAKAAWCSKFCKEQVSARPNGAWPCSRTVSHVNCRKKELECVFIKFIVL